MTFVEKIELLCKLRAALGIQTVRRATFTFGADATTTVGLVGADGSTTVTETGVSFEHALDVLIEKNREYAVAQLQSMKKGIAELEDLLERLERG